MATKPTRQQERACDLVAEALLLIAEAARLDGRASFGRAEIAEIARSIARAASAFDLDEIVFRAIESRGRTLGLRAGTAELLSLVHEEADPIATLFVTDDTFKGLVAEAEEELGEV